VSTTSISSSPGPSSAVQPPTHPLLSVSNRASVSSTSCDFALAKDTEQEGQTQPENLGGEQVSAADYDPGLDRREDEYKRLRR
jgi:serine/threonine-protein kinase PRP4